jgi:hypothetical protein
LFSTVVDRIQPLEFSNSERLLDEASVDEDEDYMDEPSVDGDVDYMDLDDSYDDYHSDYESHPIHHHHHHHPAFFANPLHGDLLL